MNRLLLGTALLLALQNARPEPPFSPLASLGACVVAPGAAWALASMRMGDGLIDDLRILAKWILGAVSVGAFGFCVMYAFSLAQ